MLFVALGLLLLCFLGYVWIGTETFKRMKSDFTRGGKKPKGWS